MQTSISTGLKIGLIVDSATQSKYLFDLAQWANSQSNLTISHLIIQTIPKRSKVRCVISRIRRKGILELMRATSFHLLEKVELFALKRQKVHRHHNDRFDLTKIVKGQISVSPVISKSRLVYRYNDSDIRAIKEEHFDVLIRCGSGILRGDILTSAKFGIISFHHGDNRINRGGPAGFWEVYFKQDRTGFIIQQLTEELDGGNVLFRGAYSTRHFYLLNQAALLERSNHYLKVVLADIAASRSLPTFDTALPYFNPIFKTPTLRQQLKYSLSWLTLVARSLINKALGKKIGWGVAFAKRDWRDVVMWRGEQIENPPNHYLADPFVVNHKGESYCFLEDYDQVAERGCISVYKLNDGSAERIGEAIVEPFHMSFPYIFEYQDKIFMCPETSANRDIRIYECVELPLKWTLRKIAMSNVSAADTMIFERNGLWWLFTNIDPTNIGDHCSELFIYYADNPLSDNWQPHPKNPIFVDSTKARNGGILFDGAAVFRVAQKQGFDGYGKGASINQIESLSTTDYSESRLISIEPNFFRGLRGTHHLHSNGEFTVFDFCK
jgi:hypothetical protein